MRLGVHTGHWFDHDNQQFREKSRASHWRSNVSISLERATRRDEPKKQEMVPKAGRPPKPPHPDISERLARDEPAKLSPLWRSAVRAGVGVLVEFHPDTPCRRAISMQALRFLLAVVAEPAGVEVARVYCIHTAGACGRTGLSLPKICYPGVIPKDFSFAVQPLSVCFYWRARRDSNS